MTFVCPKCGYRTVQEDIVKGCSHWCPMNRGKTVVLVKEKPA